MFPVENEVEKEVEKETTAKKLVDIFALLFFLFGFVGIGFSVSYFLSKPYNGVVSEGFALPSKVEVDIYDFENDGVPETIISYDGGTYDGGTGKTSALLKVDTDGNLSVVKYKLVFADVSGEEGERGKEEKGAMKGEGQ